MADKLLPAADKYQLEGLKVSVLSRLNLIKRLFISGNVRAIIGPYLNQ
jgi:hypothetical protein